MAKHNLTRALRIRRRRSDATKLLRPAEFDQAAACERMRVDRNQSPLSILLITLPEDAAGTRDVHHLADLLASRLRITDTAGRLRDGRVGVLLPDTPQAGAWKVAADICDQYKAGLQRPACEVMVYPDETSLGPTKGRGEGEGHDGGTRVPEPTVHASSSQLDTFFARTTPWWKRAIDIAGSTVGLVVAAPVIGVAAAAVTLTSPGGPFYAQLREGHGGRRFRIYKIRTMHQGADRIKDRLRSRNEQDGPAFKMTKDPRVTRVGRFLRKTSLDELPQLLNVLRGEMSLVGPRPLPIDESLACEPWQRRRLTVKPGITCIWQVKGRSVVTFEEWARMDLEYAHGRSWWTDLKLLVQTPHALLVSKGPR